MLSVEWTKVKAKKKGRRGRERSRKASGHTSRTRRKLKRGKEGRIGTELDQVYFLHDTCACAGVCTFAHHVVLARHALRETQHKRGLCLNFLATGACTFGSRCVWVHSPWVSDAAMVEREAEEIEESCRTEREVLGLAPLPSAAHVRQRGVRLLDLALRGAAVGGGQRWRAQFVPSSSAASSTAAPVPLRHVRDFATLASDPTWDGEVGWELETMVRTVRGAKRAAARAQPLRLARKLSESTSAAVQLPAGGPPRVLWVGEKATVASGVIARQVAFLRIAEAKRRGDATWWERDAVDHGGLVVSEDDFAAGILLAACLEDEDAVGLDLGSNGAEWGVVGEWGDEGGDVLVEDPCRLSPVRLKSHLFPYAIPSFPTSTKPHPLHPLSPTAPSSPPPPSPSPSSPPLATTPPHLTPMETIVKQCAEQEMVLARALQYISINRWQGIWSLIQASNISFSQAKSLLLHHSPTTLSPTTLSTIFSTIPSAPPKPPTPHSNRLSTLLQLATGTSPPAGGGWESGVSGAWHGEDGEEEEEGEKEVEEKEVGEVEIEEKKEKEEEAEKLSALTSPLLHPTSSIHQTSFPFSSPWPSEAAQVAQRAAYDAVEERKESVDESGDALFSVITPPPAATAQEIHLAALSIAPPSHPMVRDASQMALASPAEEKPMITARHAGIYDNKTPFSFPIFSPPPAPFQERTPLPILKPTLIPSASS